MKKQIIPKKSGLNLNKKTISNLDASEMLQKIGGVKSAQATNCCWTAHGHTCAPNCGSF